MSRKRKASAPASDDQLSAPKRALQRRGSGSKGPGASRTRGQSQRLRGQSARGRYGKRGQMDDTYSSSSSSSNDGHEEGQQLPPPSRSTPLGAAQGCGSSSSSQGGGGDDDDDDDDSDWRGTKDTDGGGDRDDSTIIDDDSEAVLDDRRSPRSVGGGGEIADCSNNSGDDFGVGGGEHSGGGGSAGRKKVTFNDARGGRGKEVGSGSRSDWEEEEGGVEESGDEGKRRGKQEGGQKKGRKARGSKGEGGKGSSARPPLRRKSYQNYGLGVRLSNRMFVAYVELPPLQGGEAKQIRVGKFKTHAEARVARDRVVLHLWGRDAELNSPPEDPCLRPPLTLEEQWKYLDSEGIIRNSRKGGRFGCTSAHGIGVKADRAYFVARIRLPDMPGNRSRQVSVGTFPTAEAAQRAHDRAYFAAFGRMGAVQGLNVNFAVPVGGDMGPLGEAELRMVLDSIKDEAAAMRIRGKGRRNGRSSPADDDARCPLTSAPRRPSAGRAVPLALRGRQPGPSGKTQATWETTAAEMDVNYKEKITMQRLKDMESLECEMRGGSFLRGFCPYLVPYNSMSPAMAELHRDPKLEGWQFLSRCMSRQNVRVKSLKACQLPRSYKGMESLGACSVCRLPHRKSQCTVTRFAEKEAMQPPVASTGQSQWSASVLSRLEAGADSTLEIMEDLAGAAEAMASAAPEYLAEAISPQALLTVAVMVQEAMRSSMEECRATRRRLEQTRDGEGATRGVSNGKGLSSSPPQTISGSTSEDSDDI